MKITFELTPIEMAEAAKNGSLQLFLANAKQAEGTMDNVRQQKELDVVPLEAPVPTPSSNLTKDEQAQVFNPAMEAPSFIPAISVPTAQSFNPLAGFTPAASAPSFNPTISAPTAAPQAQSFDPNTMVATIDEVRATIAPIIKAGKMAEIQALFAEFGAQKVTDVDPSKYNALIERARKI